MQRTLAALLLTIIGLAAAAHADELMLTGDSVKEPVASELPEEFGSGAYVDEIHPEAEVTRVVVPEPGTLGMLGMGIVGMVIVLRRRRTRRHRTRERANAFTSL